MMNNFFLILLLLIIFSCKEENNRTETIEKNGYTVEKIIKRDSIISSKTFDKNKKLVWEIYYKNGIVTKATEYYSNNKIKSTSTLEKAPNHYYDISYYSNGKKEREGESDYYKDIGGKLRRGATIFYNQSGNVYAIMFFMNDENREFLTRHSIFDTIRNKTIKDEKYDPPLPLK